MDEYLAFVDFIGRTIDRKYIYRLDFTYDSDAAWGDYFNAVPSVTVPDIRLDANCISSSTKIALECKMLLAKSSYCFSMQDCIDGILPLCFPDLSGEYQLIDNKPLIFRFGETLEEINERLYKWAGCIIIEHTENVQNTDVIDNLIEDFSNNDLDPEDF